MVNSMFYGCCLKLRTQFAEGRPLEAEKHVKLGTSV